MSLFQQIFRQKYVHWVLATFLAFFLMWKGFWPGWNNITGDFGNYYTASKLIREGQPPINLYNDRWFNEQAIRTGFQGGRFSQFPPITAFIYMPLTFFDPLTSKRIWMLINILFLVWLILLLKKITQWPVLELSELTLLCGYNLSNNFSQGQVYLVLLLTIVLGYHWYSQSSRVLSSMLLGAGAIVKYFSLIFIPIFIVRKSWSAVLYLATTFGILLFVQLTFFGMESNRLYYESIFIPHLNGYIPAGSAYAIAYQSWTGLFSYWFRFDAVQNPNPIVDSGTLFYLFKYLIVIVIGGLTLANLYRIRLHPNSLSIQVTLTSIAMLTILPVSATYHFVLLLFPLILLLKFGDLTPLKKIVFVGIFSAIGFLPIGKFVNLHWTGSMATLAYPRLFLMLLFFVLLMLHITKIKNHKSLQNDS